MNKILDKYISNLPEFTKTMIARKINDWQTFGFHNYPNTYYDLLKEDGYFDIIYEITQKVTFNNTNKRIKLYRGVTVKQSDFWNILSNKEITTNKCSSFTDSKHIATDFSSSLDNQYNFGILLSAMIDTKDILMTYKDWLGEESINNGQSESEYVFLNPTQKTIKIEIVEKYGYDKYGIADKI